MRTILWLAAVPMLLKKYCTRCWLAEALCCWNDRAWGPYEWHRQQWHSCKHPRFADLYTTCRSLLPRLSPVNPILVLPRLSPVNPILVSRSLDIRIACLNQSRLAFAIIASILIVFISVSTFWLMPPCWHFIHDYIMLLRQHLRWRCRDLRWRLYTTHVSEV